MRLNKNFLFKQLAVVAGLVGAGTLLSLPAMAAIGSQSEGITIAQSNGGSSGDSSGTSESGQSGVDPTNPDPSGGGGFEQSPGGQPLPDANQQDDSGSTVDEGAGSGTGGVQDSEINPANPDAEGGEAFEREPTGEPVPSETEGTTDSTSPSGTTTDEGAGSGQGGFNNPVNPANPDPTGGEAYEEVPGTQPLPQSNEQGGGASGTYNQSGSTTNDATGGGAGGASGTYNQSGTTTDDATGGGAGGSTDGGTGAVRALW